MLINHFIEKHEMLILDMRYVDMLDISGIFALEDLIKNVQAKNIKVYITNIKHHLKELLNKVEFNKHIGEEHYKDSKKTVSSIISEQYNL